MIFIQLHSQKFPSLIDTSIVIPTVVFDDAGNLIINASKTSSQNDFDFLIGSWRLKNKKLKSRFKKCIEWIEFESTVEMFTIMNGVGNIDRYKAKLNNNPYEGIALRLYDKNTKLWRIYWADQDSGTLDPPLIGSFENNIGHFFTRDTFQGKAIIVVFRWDVRNKIKPIWSQAFSDDFGKTWEWNFVNVSEKMH